MTRNKKDKKANAVAKIARKTIGLVVLVGDALEAAVAAGTPPPPSPSTSSAPAAPAIPAATPVAASPDPSPVENRARAITAIEVYATLHNLGAVDMPSEGTLVEALIAGMARHGSEFTDAHVRHLIDEQMRIHFRTLGMRNARLDREA